ncbi:MAG: Gfo/Idh/MocA family oxidoreductase [Candidatus Omnitrophica bacterium]|nr:Gfo/Idh/MocA family oxidoreductase [Candidatus Omnitrophota bacterium]
MNKKIKVAVVGAGHWGKNLVRCLNELKVLKTVCDNDKKVLRDYAKNVPGIHVTCDFNSVVKDAEIDAVVISTPAVTHFRLAKEALAAGKHVFVEKPLSLFVKDAKTLMSLSEKKGVILMVGHILHYHPAVLKLKQMLDRGALGKVSYVYSHRLNIGRFRQEENVLWSFAPHDISCILMLLGKYPKEVGAFGLKCLQKGIYDTTLTTLGFSRNIKAHIFVSWLHPCKEQKLIVVGDKGMAVFDDLSVHKLTFYSRMISWQKEIPFACKGRKKIIPFKMEEPLKMECRHFIDCIARGATPHTDGREGVDVLQVLNAAEHSLRLNGKIIKSL